MNIEEIEIIQKEIDNKYLETQDYGRNQFVCKIVELERYIETLQSQLDKSNSKLDKIKEYCNNNINYYNDPDVGAIKQCEINGLDILSIIGGE